MEVTDATKLLELENDELDCSLPKHYWTYLRSRACSA